ncbi:BppU family phage baseplate upper protein, partial [Staphylococcus capitis]|uniref:BppU family phage baseplate upper protein n=1 Tax=Staphylococcus capitis TaxID=29388 RepID=UPI0037099507
MHNNTSLIHIHINKNNIINQNQQYISLNFNHTNFQPVLHLFPQHPSIFTNHPLQILKPEEPFLTYIIPQYITKHLAQMQSKLFLQNPQNNHTTH